MSRPNKLQKFADNSKLKHVIEPGYYDLEKEDLNLKGRWHIDFFNNNNPIICEFGCGKGEYTINLAEQNPNKNYIGVDIKGARIWKGATKVLEQNIKNIAFLRTRVEFTPKCFENNEIDEIWITFPDPQLRKKKRIKKRLTSSRFLTYYQKILKNNSIINLKTDDDELYEYTHELVKQNNLEITRNYSDLYSLKLNDPVLDIKTYYESRWLEEGKTIKLISFKLPKEKIIVEPKLSEE